MIAQMVNWFTDSNIAALLISTLSWQAWSVQQHSSCVLSHQVKEARALVDHKTWKLTMLLCSTQKCSWIIAACKYMPHPTAGNEDKEVLGKWTHTFNRHFPSRWTALMLAVENEWGGRESRRKADELYDNILAWFYDHKGRSPLIVEASKTKHWLSIL